jgi:hypothetical protein
MTPQTLEPVWEYKLPFHHTLLYINYNFTFFYNWSLYVIVLLWCCSHSQISIFPLILRYASLGGVFSITMDFSSHVQYVCPILFVFVFCLFSFFPLFIFHQRFFLFIFFFLFLYSLFLFFVLLNYFLKKIL